MPRRKSTTTTMAYSALSAHFMPRRKRSGWQRAMLPPFELPTCWCPSLIAFNLSRAMLKHQQTIDDARFVSSTNHHTHDRAFVNRPIMRHLLWQLELAKTRGHHQQRRRRPLHTLEAAHRVLHNLRSAKRTPSEQGEYTLCT
eukprot:990397-Pleurochrysis_carterae.AAC.1